MSSSQLGVPRGTRDFNPETMAKRQFIFEHIKSIFQKYGFQPLETPSMENLSVLTGKYGDEGDQLLFKVLNSGDFLKKTTSDDYHSGYADLLNKITEKGLRYDLTVPFARYVAMHRHRIIFPFKRYQMQPVWRADRPQKGRYREFYQCDADVIGTDSLICEAEIISMINEIFSLLGIKDYTIHINHRKILAGVSEAIGAPGQEATLANSLDKLNKIGSEKVLQELKEKGFEKRQLQLLEPIFQWQGNWTELEGDLRSFLGNSPTGSKGLSDIENIYQYIDGLGLKDPHLLLNVSLARGLSYYTGTIFEVMVNNVQIGSVCGGGRYDDLTGIFGLPGVSGVGISFGVDRLFDVMEELKLFPPDQLRFSEVLLVSMDDHSEAYALGVLNRLRKNNIASELYPDRAKLKKPLNYADKKGIPLVVLIGSNEMASGKLTVKQMSEGTQSEKTEEELLQFLRSTH